MQTVSNEAVTSYFPLVDRFARMFRGRHGAEYDDLFQEGSEKVFCLLRDGKRVSNTAIKNAMRDWVRKCASRGMVYALPEDA